MRGLEELLALFLAAVALASAARRVGAPYPVFLALGGAVLAFVPGAPSFTVPPELALALFVAPVLLDAAFDASLRDLQRQLGAGDGPRRLRRGADDSAVAVVVRTRCRRCLGRRPSYSAPSSRRQTLRPRPRCCGSSGRRIAS